MSTIHAVTDYAKDINYVYGTVTIVVSLVFLGVAIPLVYALVKFRDRPGDTHIPRQVHGDFRLELAWTLIPVVLLIFIFVPTFRVIFRQAEGSGTKPYIVKVIGHQWWWEFEYPNEKVVTANEVHLPANTQIQFQISSEDVIHSFWVPRFGGKMDALPGEINVLNIVTPPASSPEARDYYQGQCAELCGLSHALMRFQAVVHSKEGFQKWLETHDNPVRALTSVEKKGMQLFTQKGCIACHAVSGVENAVGRIGPNLSAFGDRKWIAAEVRPNTHEGLQDWLKNYAEIKPNVRMVAVPLEDSEINSLSKFLRHSTAKDE